MLTGFSARDLDFLPICISLLRPILTCDLAMFVDCFLNNKNDIRRGDAHRQAGMGPRHFF